MNNPKKIIIAALLVLFSAGNAAALVDFSDTRAERQLTAAGFYDYPPFGYVSTEFNQDNEEKFIRRHYLFKELLEEFAEENNAVVTYMDYLTDYNGIIRNVRSGDIDILLGMYHDTKLFAGLDYVLPAPISNPITLMTLPSRRGEIKSLEDVKKLKGAILEKEVLSDYVNEQMKDYDVIKIRDPNELFKKLFTKEIDYVFTGYYTGLIEASKLGLRNYVAFSKQIIWDIPLFIGVSKVSKNRTFLIGRLGKYLEKKEVQEKFKKHLLNVIHEFEVLNNSVTPPMYTK